MNPNRNPMSDTMHRSAPRRVPVSAIVLAVACGAALFSRPVSAAAATPAEEDTSGDVVELEAFEVEAGYRQSLQQALVNKRKSDSIVDGISAEGIGVFPDLNLGESLQRVTGVQINRSNSNPNNSPRDASINLRGLPNDFSRTVINGLPFADPVDDGGTSFGVLQADLFSGLDVIKAPTAGMSEGGLSGIINLKTAKPLDLVDGGMVLTVKGVYEELTEDLFPVVSFFASKHFKDHKLGVSFAAIYSEESYRRDTTLVTRYSQLNNAAGQPVTMPDGGRVFYPGQMRQIVSSYDGDVLGINSAVQYEISDQLETTVSLLYSTRELDRPFDLWVVSDQGATTAVTPRSDPVFAGNNASGQPEYVVRDVSLTNIDTTQGPRPGRMDDEILNVHWETEWNNDVWRVTGAAAYSEGTNITETIQYDYRYGGANGLIANVSTGGGDWKGFSLDVTDAANRAFAGVSSLQNTVGNYVAAPPHTLEAQSAIGGYNRLIIADTDSSIDTDMIVFDLEAEREIELPVISSVAFGVRYSSGTEDSFRQRHTIYGIDSSKFATEFINNDLVTDVHYLDGDSFMGGNASTLNNWLSLDGALIENRLQPVTPPQGLPLGSAGWVSNPFDGGVRNGIYTAETDVISAYGQVNLESKIGNKPVRGNIGLRFVDTEIDLQSIRDNQGVIETVETSNGYDHLLPSANVAVELTDDLVVRAAYAETFVRPLNRDNSPSESISVSLDQSDPNPIKATLGNTALEPYEAKSYDVSLEWYNRAGSAVTLAWFHKEIEGFITNVDFCPPDGAGLPFGPLTGTGVRDSAGVFDCFTSDGTGIIVSQQQNSADTVDVEGVELSVQQNLDFLPGFWSHFGGVFNYSIIDVSGEINGVPVRLGGVSETNYNLIVFYEDKSFSVRFAYNWRDEYELGEGGTFSGAARSVKERGQLDASVSWNVTDKLTLSLEAFNLTQEPLEEFEGNSNRPRRTDYDGSTFILGARYVF